MNSVDRAFSLNLAWSDSRMPHHTGAETASSLAMEYSALHEHLGACTGISRSWAALHSMVHAVYGFFVTRFVTTLVVLLLLIGLISIAL